MITHTISVTELIWTVFCSFGLFFNGKIFFRAIGDLTSLRVRKINSLRAYSARLTVFAYGTWTFVQLMFVLMGMASMTYGPPKGYKTQVTPLSIIVTGGFLVVSFVLAFGSYKNESGRQKLLRMIADLEEPELAPTTEAVKSV